MASQRPLTQTVSVVLDASGNGTASDGPTGFGETWTGICVAVHAATDVSEATCRVYVGTSASPNFFADGTTWGSTGDSSDNMPSTVPVGYQVFAVWSGGDAGTTAYLNITGTDNVA
jgi:hypothetical protein